MLAVSRFLVSILSPNGFFTVALFSCILQALVAPLVLLFSTNGFYTRFVPRIILNRTQTFERSVNYAFEFANVGRSRILMLMLLPSVD